MKLLFHLGRLIQIATPLNLAEYPEIIPGTIMLFFQIAMYLVFRVALKATFKKAGRPMKGDPLLGVSCLTAVVFVLALSPFSSSWLVFISLVTCYILIVRSLFSIGEQLGDTGYMLTNAPVRISNEAFSWTYFIVALAIMMLCNAFSNHLRLEPQEYSRPATTEARQQLLGMGFSAEALRYLSDEDVTMLGGAVDVASFSKLLMFDARRVEQVEHRVVYGGGETYTSHTYKPGKKNIEATTVYIEMPGKVVYVMQYFFWKGGRPIWQDGILISGEPGMLDRQIVSSCLFFSKGGKEYTAPFPRLACEQITHNSMFGPCYSVMIRGALPWPLERLPGSTENWKARQIDKNWIKQGKIKLSKIRNN
ncbi:MAG TPA: hypothetical protein GX697_02695 [Firmicutes bacterium]|nr:hypothetical protein [Bacillota bacterium]